MGAGFGPDFGKTLHTLVKESPFFKDGSVTLASLSEHREMFLGKSVGEIQSMMSEVGYETTVRKSNRSTSRAEIIVVSNSSTKRNVQQVQVSPGSKRHGNVPYVKISTSNIGKIKIVDSAPKEYKSDGSENAILLFRRN